jgi:RNA polymerase sigma-70 factor (ECF subfamily)
MKLFQKISDEEKLVQNCIRGRSDAQEQLYKMHYRVMFGVCLRYAQDRDAAEDILQEGFIKVFNNLAKYRNEGSLEGWIRRIMVNTALDHYRKTSRLVPITDLEQAKQESVSADAISDMRTEELLKLIQALPDGYRTVFNLYAIEGYNHQEIAEKLGISEGTSKSQLSRAREYLQRQIHQWKEEIYGTA